MPRQNIVRVAVPVCVRRWSEMPQALTCAAERADLAELRLDYLEPEEFEKAARSLKGLVAKCPCPVILTLRPVKEGGRSTLSALERHSFWFRALVPAARSIDFVDLEFESAVMLSLWEKEGLLSLNGGM